MAAIGGALSELTKPYNWEQTDEASMTPEQSAELFSSILLGYYNSECGTSEVPTPYWTDAENVDDSLPPEIQEWYGFFTNFDESWDDMSFVEQATVWAYSGMIASAYSPGAAIVFRTTISRFLFAVRQRDFGGIVRLLMDGEDVGTYDTSENPDTVLYVPVQGDPEASLHEFRVINVSPTGVGAMELRPIEVIRKYLSEDELLDGRRYNDATDTFEYSPDGGVTWHDDSASDPRTSEIYRLPPLAGGEKCNAAARMVAQIEQQIDTALSFTSQAGIAMSLMMSLATLVIGVGWVVDLFLIIAGALLSIGSEAIFSAMTPTVYDKLKCILNTALESNGQLPNNKLDMVRGGVNAEIGGVAAVVLNLMFDGFGAVQLSNAGVLRSETGDCDCDECPVGYNDQLIGSLGWRTSLINVTPNTSSYVNSGGHAVGGGRVTSDFNASSGYQTQVRIDLGQDCYVESFSGWFKSANTGGFRALYMRLYNEAGTLVFNGTFTLANTTAWTQFYRIIGVGVGRYVQFLGQTNSAAGQHSLSDFNVQTG